MSAKAYSTYKCLFIAILSCFCFIALNANHFVYADVPAVTDFGQNDVRAVVKDDSPVIHHSRALFLTFYEDGRHDASLREIHGDAVVGFASGRSAWRLDGGLMWFVEMPVYVREVHNTANNNLDLV